MTAPEFHLIGGDVSVEGKLRFSKGRYWIRQGFGKVVVLTGIDIEMMVGRRVSVFGTRARARVRGRNVDALWVSTRRGFSLGLKTIWG